MSEPQRPAGLRERKKVRTREAIRREAFRLFDERGFAYTTIEQIAEAADISPSTFFRYFPSKESVLLADDLRVVMLETLAAQPVEMAHIAAFRAAVHAAYEQMTTAIVDEVKKARGKSKLSSPAMIALREEYDRTIEPARRRLVEAAALERRLNDLVNAAYGLTADDVALMWATAPPRMPIARPGG